MEQHQHPVSHHKPHGELFPLQSFTYLLDSCEILNLYYVQVFKFLLNFKLAFQTVGWAVSSAVWNALRPGVNSLDPDIQGSINNGLIDGDFSATNLALGAGQVGVTCVTWPGQNMSLDMLTELDATYRMTSDTIYI